MVKVIWGFNNMLTISDEIILLSKIIYILNKFNIRYISKEDLQQLFNILNDDKKAYLFNDPSTHKNASYLLLSFSSFESVLGYRIANYIYYQYNERIDAKKISEYFKVKTGIEIHPACKIGKNFVIDHGVGTVIGETCVIGDNCYLLQNIILGSSNIAKNKDEIRHPIIGNNVEIGGYVRIFGRIKIGNNVKISPHSIIYENIPDNHIVTIKSNKQYIKKR